VEYVLQLATIAWLYLKDDKRERDTEQTNSEHSLSQLELQNFD